LPQIKISYNRPFLYPYQTAILDSKARYTVTAAATKVGKTASHIVWLFEQAINLKKGQACWWIAPTFSQAKIAFDRLKLQLTNTASKDLFFECNETNLIIELITGGKICFKTAEKPDNLYGDDVYAAVFDEFTRAREAAWFALRSTLTSTGGKCKFIGNVKGRKNWGYKLGVKAKDPEEKDFEFFKITAYDAAAAGMMTKDGKPFIEEIEAAKKDLPESVFNELYLAEPNEDGSNPFGLSHIQRCVYDISTKPPVCFGIDLAKKMDYTAITGLDVDGAVCYFDRFQNDWKQTKEKIIALPPGNIAIDSTGVGDAVAEDICRDRDVELVVYSSRVKQQLMEGLAYSIQHRAITVLEGVMRDELDSFEFKYSSSGVTYSAPSGMHDDCVNSLALAVKAFNKVKRFHREISIW
jgi:hypothetical protein